MKNNYILGVCSEDKRIKLFDLNPLRLNNIPVEIYCHHTEHLKEIRSLSFS